MIGARLAGAEDEYSFKWLDPEKKVYVLQNRRYTKAHRVFLSVMAGPGISNPYRTTYNVDPRLTYYFSDQWGIEAFYTAAIVNSNNSNFDALISHNPNTLPSIREIRASYGGLIHWSPWYAKINFFNKILYFDWYLAGGAGTLHTSVGSKNLVTDPITFTDQDLFAVFVGTGQQFHLTDVFKIRLDFSGAIYQAPIYRTSGDTAWYTNYNFGLGFGIGL